MSYVVHNYNVSTIDDLIKVLHKAKSIIGGNKPLILSLTNSEISDCNIEYLSIWHGDKNDGSYIQFEVKNEELLKALNIDIMVDCPYCDNGIQGNGSMYQCTCNICEGEGKISKRELEK